MFQPILLQVPPLRIYLRRQHKIATTKDIISRTIKDIASSPTINIASKEIPQDIISCTKKDTPDIISRTTKDIALSPTTNNVASKDIPQDIISYTTKDIVSANITTAEDIALSNIVLTNITTITEDIALSNIVLTNITLMPRILERRCSNPNPHHHQ